MEVAEISANSKNPEGGIIERADSGEPNGILHETAMDLVYDRAPLMDISKKVKAFDVGIKRLLECGITAYQVSVTNQHL